MFTFLLCKIYKSKYEEWIYKFCLRTQTTLWSTYKLYDLHAIIYSTLSVSKSIFMFPRVITFYYFLWRPLTCGGPWATAQFAPPPLNPALVCCANLWKLLFWLTASDVHSHSFPFSFPSWSLIPIPVGFPWNSHSHRHLKFKRWSGARSNGNRRKVTFFSEHTISQTKSRERSWNWQAGCWRRSWCECVCFIVTFKSYWVYRIMVVRGSTSTVACDPLKKWPIWPIDPLPALLCIVHSASFECLTVDLVGGVAQW